MTETRLVVGSGPSSVAVTHALLERGFDVTVLDVGATLDTATTKVVETMSRQEPEQWSEADKAVIQRVDFQSDAAVSPKRLFGSSFVYFRDPRLEAPDDMLLYGSRAFGGLSNIWGCALLPATAGDLSGWPPEVARAIATGYPTIRNIVQECIGADILSRDTHLTISASAKAMLERFGQLPAANVEFDVYPTPLAISRACKACNACMYGCVYDYTYASRHTIESKYLGHPRYRYVSGITVERFVETESGVHVHAVNAAGQAESFQGRQLFLAAGMMGTLRIVWNSSPRVARTLHLRDASYFLIPGLLPPLTARRNARHHGLSHLSVDLAEPPFAARPAHVQLYFNNPAVSDGLKARLGRLNVGPLSKLIEFMARFLVVGQGYLHSDFCHRLKLEWRDGVIQASVERNPDNAKFIDLALTQFVKSMRKLGVQFVKPAASVIAYGASKTAGAMPHASIPSPANTDLLGRPFGARNVFIVDGTVMCSVPARNHSMTTLANALRIGQAA
jgi:hypothetical protein